MSHHPDTPWGTARVVERYALLVLFLLLLPLLPLLAIAAFNYLHLLLGAVNSRANSKVNSTGKSTGSTANTAPRA